MDQSTIITLVATIAIVLVPPPLILLFLGRLMKIKSQNFNFSNLFLTLLISFLTLRISLMPGEIIFRFSPPWYAVATLLFAIILCAVRIHFKTSYPKSIILALAGVLTETLAVYGAFYFLISQLHII